MISTATKTLQANNKMIYVALLSTLTFFLFLDYIPGLEALGWQEIAGLRGKQFPCIIPECQSHPASRPLCQCAVEKG